MPRFAIILPASDRAIVQVGVRDPLVRFGGKAVPSWRLRGATFFRHHDGDHDRRPWRLP